MNAAMERYDESQREEQRLRERALRHVHIISKQMNAAERSERPSNHTMVYVVTALKTLRRVTLQAKEHHDIGTQALRDSGSPIKLKHHTEDWEEFQETVDRS